MNLLVDVILYQNTDYCIRILLVPNNYYLSYSIGLHCLTSFQYFNSYINRDRRDADTNIPGCDILVVFHRVCQVRSIVTRDLGVKHHSNDSHINKCKLPSLILIMIFVSQLLSDSRATQQSTQRRIHSWIPTLSLCL